MTQREVDVYFTAILTVHTHEWFANRRVSQSREDVMVWAAKQLAETVNVYTIPCGASWGMITTKEIFEKHYKKIN